MIIMLESDAPACVVATVVRAAEQYPDVKTRIYEFQGSTTTVIEIHLIGSTRMVPESAFERFRGVRKVVRVSAKYRLIGRHHPDSETQGFEYKGVRFDDHHTHLFAGLCAVDNREHVEAMMAALASEGIVTTRMGAYKPRTSPYDFQGLGKECLPWVFELAGKYGIRVIAMEVTDGRHIDEIHRALALAGNPTGVMLQIGTRNTQNFELLKLVGQQREFPVLFKRGMGITLEESLNACEYVASEGNQNIVFCLRGVKTHLGDPHRNLVDFAHVPVLRRLTRLSICIDPSHSTGRLDKAPDGLPDIFHVTGQGIIAGATMALVDFHPRPEKALCDAQQALGLEYLPRMKRYIEAVRRAFVEVTREAA